MELRSEETRPLHKFIFLERIIVDPTDVRLRFMIVVSRRRRPKIEEDLEFDLNRISNYELEKR